MRKGKIDIITMGCSKNLVDSERLHRRLSAKRWEVCHDPSEVNGEIVIVNTCGFIGDAKEESINMILDLVRAKDELQIGRLIVMGCLSERYRKELPESIPEVDDWYGKFDWDSIITSLPDIKPEIPVKTWERDLSTPPWSAYIKISEGCDRMCAYCAIPLITGRHKSRSEEEIIEEIKDLVSQGVREFNIIAQDLSAYGHDLYGESRLASLLSRISDIQGVEWIRLHYAYPADFPYDILPLMRERKNICNYLDIALQHISDPVLENMRRHVTKEDTVRLIERIRAEVPGIRLRTTLMTGFPGERDQEFKELMDFVRETKFERMGAFAYCEEDDTWAQRHLKDSVPEDVKQSRLDALMELQENISAELHRKLIGEKVKVLVESVDGDTAVGRTEWDSPEVDPEVYVRLKENSSVSPGDFIFVHIDSTDAFELFGSEL